MSRHIAIVFFLLLFNSPCFAVRPVSPEKTASPEKTVSPGKLDSKALRDSGPEGLEIALRHYDRLKSIALETSHSGQLERVQNQIAEYETLLDEIAGQRHASVSRLFWYTDLERAKQQAKAENKPILSLRMLGHLTDEFSCANSRFFRTALYANKEISDLIREQFVLHWQSVRPVPKVTIDFGDGRKLERTVTGNSAHYLLSTEGTPLEALPGLYNPKEFLEWLNRAEKLAVKYGNTPDEERSTFLSDYHHQRELAIQADWQNDIKEVAPELMEYGGLGSGDALNQELLFVDATEAAQLAISKRRVELPIIRAIKASPQKTDQMVSDKLWLRLASLKRGETKLDQSSVELMRQLNPNAFQAGQFAFAKAIAEDPILRIVRNFEDSIALDTVRNEYLLHRQLHSWFAKGEVSNDVDQLNERVYAELFLTPSSDPWLGLLPPDTYTALQDGGISVQMGTSSDPQNSPNGFPELNSLFQ